MLAAFQDLQSHIFMGGIWSTNVDGIALLEEFFKGLGGMAPEPAGHRLRTGRVQIKESINLDPGILRQNGGVNPRDTSRPD
jgi:hypothetical protein